MRAGFFRFASVAVIAVVLGFPVAAVADDRAFPHLHYRGEVFGPDGAKLNLAVSFRFADMPQLAPPGCYAPPPGVAAGGSSGGSYTLIIGIKDTPECLAAMQTFVPSTFPIPTASGWVFRRQ